MRAYRSRLAGVVFCLFFNCSAWADAPPEPVALAPIEHPGAELTVVAPNGETASYTVETLEAHPTYRLVTKTPWREEQAVFEGVLLADVLASNGLDAAPAIRVTAENDFTSDIPQAAWREVPILIATRVNGRPIPRRERGPLLFVVEDAAYHASPNVLEQHLVWMAKRIERAR